MKSARTAKPRPLPSDNLDPPSSRPQQLAPEGTPPGGQPEPSPKRPGNGLWILRETLERAAIFAGIAIVAYGLEQLVRFLEDVGLNHLVAQILDGVAYLMFASDAAVFGGYLVLITYRALMEMVRR